MNPIRFRGTVPVGRAGEENPSIRQLICMPPRVFFAMSRSAWITVSALPGRQLQYQVAAALRRVKVVVGERRHRRQVRGTDGGEPVPVIEQRRADAERHRQPVGHHRRPEDAGVGRRPVDPDRRRGPARGQEPGAVGHGLEEVGQFRPVRGGRVERHHRGGPRRRGQDARLVLPVERDRGQPPGHDRRVGGGGGVSRASRGTRTRPRPPAAPPATTPPATPPAMPRRNDRRPGRRPRPAPGRLTRVGLTRFLLRLRIHWRCSSAR